jgi:putative hydrolase of the HAD superfamily
VYHAVCPAFVRTPVWEDQVMVRAVLLDLDDTLFDHRGCSRDALEAVQRCHDTLGVVPIAELEQVHSTILEQLHGDVMLGRVPLEEARRERFRRLLRTRGPVPSEAVVELTAAAYRDRYREVRRAVRGAGALLAALAGRARIAIVSNNLFDEQSDKLRVCGLDRFVDALVVSEKVGVSKPDPAIFAAALERMQCSAGEAVMVGDSWTADIAGARAAGIRAVWFNPLMLPRPADEPPVAELRALEPTDAALEMILGPAEP